MKWSTTDHQLHRDRTEDSTVSGPQRTFQTKSVGIVGGVLYFGGPAMGPLIPGLCPSETQPRPPSGNQLASLAHTNQAVCVLRECRGEAVPRISRGIRFQFNDPVPGPTLREPVICGGPAFTFLPASNLSDICSRSNLIIRQRPPARPAAPPQGTQAGPGPYVGNLQGDQRPPLPPPSLPVGADQGGAAGLLLS